LAFRFALGQPLKRAVAPDALRRSNALNQNDQYL